MKFLLTFYILIIGHFTIAQNLSNSDYEKRVSLILEKIEAKETILENNKDLKAIAFDLQNRGQILDESKHDYKSSLNLVTNAITIFNYLDDTLNIANNLKFRGYLLGRFEKFSEAKYEIKQAINLFRLKNKEWGVAVSEFDLSRVYEFENKLDSAIYYCSSSLTYWKTKNNISRIVNNQNMLINLLVKANELVKAKSIQEESQQQANNPGLNWQDIIDYYFVSAQLYKALNISQLSIIYKVQYQNKVSELKKENIVAKSYFDISL